MDGELDGLLVNEQVWNGGWLARKGKFHYAALLTATGSPKSARELAPEVIVWLNGFPSDKVLKDWEMLWQEGQIEVSENDVRKMRQKLMANEEWRTRQAIRAATNASIALSQRAADNTLPATKQVQLQYAGMTTAYLTKEVAAAYGTPKPTMTAMNQIIQINAGAPPPKRIKAPKRKELVQAAEAEIIDAEVREIVNSND